jgi:hypothetical protein
MLVLRIPATKSFRIVFIVVLLRVTGCAPK